MLLFSAALTPLYKEVCRGSSFLQIICLVSDICPPQTSLDMENLGQFLESILKWTLGTADSDLQRDAAIHLVAVIVNRKVDGAYNKSITSGIGVLRASLELEGFLEGFSTKFWSNEVLNAELSPERRHWAIITWNWVCILLAALLYTALTRFI